MSSFLIFKDISDEYDKITKTIEVKSTGNVPLGLISWYTHWRRYCFYPVTNTIFDSNCLERIKEEIDTLMRDRKK